MPGPEVAEPTLIARAGELLGAVLGGFLAAAGVQRYKRRRIGAVDGEAPKARVTDAIDWRALVDAVDRQTQTLERLIDSNREEHESTRRELRSVNEGTRNAVAGLLATMNQTLATVAAGVSALLTKAMANGGGK